MRTFPYQKAGKAFDSYTSVEHAFGAAGLRWTVNPYPIGANVGSEFVPIDEHYAIVREDNQTPLGVVKTRYEIVDNHDVEALLDNINMPVQSAGVRKGGRKCFVLFKQDEFLHGRDTYYTHLVSQWSHDGSMPLTVSFLAHRLRCTNGMNTFLGGREVVKIRHTQSASVKLAQAVAAVEKAPEWQTMFRHELEFMSGQALTTGNVATILNSVLPQPKVKDEKARAKVAGRRAAKINAILDNYWKMGEHTGTLYGLVQALNEYEFWQAPVRGGKAARAESQMARLEQDRFPLVHKTLALVGAEQEFARYWAPIEGAVI